MPPTEPPPSELSVFANSITATRCEDCAKARESHIYATILAIPNYRLQATDKTVITFAERAVGEPQAIRAWFYPGDNSGQEFVYPKKRAVELAKITSHPVRYIPDEVAPNIIATGKVPTEPQ